MKRSFDVAVAAAGLVMLSPLLALVALSVRLLSGSPVLFVQERVGLRGSTFRLFKFRTMKPAPEGALLVTGDGDPRVTGLGRLLRSTKCDELPQLFNVLKGDMSLVGPRPEVPRYAASYTADQRRVLEVRPGVTDPATILFRDEERLLGSVSESLREPFYITSILPTKLAINLTYIENAGFWYDLKLILATLVAIVRPRPA